MISLLDVNVLVALLVPEHEHHVLAQEWFAKEAAVNGWATSAVTELGAIRVCAQLPGGPWAPEKTADRLLMLTAASREYIWWPDAISPVMLPEVRAAGTAKQVTDRYLLGVARKNAGRLAMRLLTVVEPRHPIVSGDPDRLQQVVWNLLSNAVKFTPSGGWVHVWLERTNSQVEIVVRDTGRGIHPDFLPHVFERFRQADGRVSREYNGLGLGLAISRHLVELHGGTIHAASDGEGKGATFRVRLPMTNVQTAPGAEPTRGHPRPEPGDGDTAGTRLDGIHVLAVDDEEDSLTLLREILETAGAQVTTVASSQEALDAVEKMAPGVIVADIGLPRMDGFELIHRIRQWPEPSVREMPAAALTAYVRSEDRQRALRSGFQVHLAKPIDPEELVAAVAALARREQADR